MKLVNEEISNTRNQLRDQVSIHVWDQINQSHIEVRERVNNQLRRLVKWQGNQILDQIRSNFK